MADLVPLTPEQRAKATRAFGDALAAELAKLPSLTHEQRDRMLRIVGAVIETGMESGQCADDMIPHFAMVFALAGYRPKVERGRGRPNKHPRGWFALTIADEATWTKLEHRYMKQIRRSVAGKKKFGRLPQSVFELPFASAESLYDMLGYMTNDSPKYAAAYAALNLPWREKGGNHPPEVRQLVDAFNRFGERGFSDDLPKMLLHRLIKAALDTDAIEEAKALVAKL